MSDNTVLKIYVYPLASPGFRIL